MTYQKMLAQGLDSSTCVSKVVIIQKYDVAGMLLPQPILNDTSLYPGYPARLLHNGMADELHYIISVTENGKIEKVTVTRYVEEAFKNAFEQAVKTWSFRSLKGLPFRKKGSSEIMTIQDDTIKYPIEVHGIIKFDVHED